MPAYNYRCTKECKLGDLPEEKRKDLDLMIAKDGDLIWEVSHGMHEEPHIKCPLCGAKATKTVLGAPMPEAYIRGYGYLDKGGCRRDMDLYKLNKGEDPYGYMRQRGEVDHIKSKLRRGGRHDPKRKIFT